MAQRPAVHCPRGGITLNDVLDDGTVSWTVRAYRFDFPRFGAFNKKETFTSSGTFTAPVSGVYRVTLQGGGGGGGGAGAGNIYPVSGSAIVCGVSGGGGGQGGHLEFYETLTAGVQYNYTVGAGGSGGEGGTFGTSPAVGKDGSNGGTSTITINGNEYTCTGGVCGSGTSAQGGGGQGGEAYVNDAHFRSGAGGSQGLISANAGLRGGSGGGSGNATAKISSPFAGNVGGGGAGGSIKASDRGCTQGTSGGDGYITFEYCDVT